MSRESEIRYSEKFYSKKFSDEVSKKAYLKACKWLAKYVLNKPEFEQVEFSIKKVANTEFELTLYAVLSEEELRERHCKICKEVHSSFFMNEEVNCAWCKVKAYQRRADDLIKTKTLYYKERLDQYLGGDWE